MDDLGMTRDDLGLCVMTEKRWCGAFDVDGKEGSLT